MFDQKKAWDAAAVAYQANQAERSADIEYGPWAPTENELKLLGSVHALRVLELGCGGGQTSLAFAKQGATVTGLDISTQQLAFARQHAQASSLQVHFVEGDVAQLASWPDTTWDLIFAAYLLPYLADVSACLGECWRLLQNNGRLVCSMDHPLWDCFFEEEEEERTLYPARNYFDHTPLRWRFPGTGVQMQHYHYTISEWLAMFYAAGFQRVQLVEPQVPLALAEATWPDDDPLSTIRNLPQTAIWIAHKVAHSEAI
jgi:SAM-dependent methyltransferase